MAPNKSQFWTFSDVCYRFQGNHFILSWLDHYGSSSEPVLTKPLHFFTCSSVLLGNAMEYSMGRKRSSTIPTSHARATSSSKLVKSLIYAYASLRTRATCILWLDERIVTSSSAHALILFQSLCSTPDRDLCRKQTRDRAQAREKQHVIGQNVKRNESLVSVLSVRLMKYMSIKRWEWFLWSYE